MPPLQARRSRAGLRWLRWVFVLFGVVSLGFVGYSLADAMLFQVHENWRLDHRPHPALQKGLLHADPSPPPAADRLGMQITT
jgi:hypothetical protein